MSTEVIILTTRASKFGSFPFIKTCIQILMKIEKTVSAMIFTLSEKSLKIEKIENTDSKNQDISIIKTFHFLYFRLDIMQFGLLSLIFCLFLTPADALSGICHASKPYHMSHNIGPILYKPLYCLYDIKYHERF